MTLLRTIATLAFLALAGQASAQAQVNLGGLSVDGDAPVEVAADSLTVDQASGQAVFEGNVVIEQGNLRLSAQRVEVVYGEDVGEITRFRASGGVVIVTEAEEAEAQEADYDIANGLLNLSGDVLLKQGASAIAAERMAINVETGAAQMEGRVRTTFGGQGGN